MKTLFGPAGNGVRFKELGFKHTLEIPEFLTQMGLNAYEYQCGHGVRISQEKAAAFGEKAREFGIRLSLHAPYYISLSSVKQEMRDNSIQYILQSARAAHWMGATRVVVHSGSCAKLARKEALQLAKDTLSRALQALKEEELTAIQLCPETMGKVNQLGTLDEVLELCSLDESLLPCVDFGHLYARSFGGITSFADYSSVLERLENRLGRERAQCFHVHFSKIAYTPTGGEKNHLTLDDESFGPPFAPLAEALVEKNFYPTIICESAGMQAEDAKTMRGLYENLVG